MNSILLIIDIRSQAHRVIFEICFLHSTGILNIL